VTSILELPITEASAKVRTGGPLDDEEDYALPHWAGVIPLQVLALPPIADERLTTSIAMPSHIAEYRLPDERDEDSVHRGTPLESAAK